MPGPSSGQGTEPDQSIEYAETLVRILWNQYLKQSHERNLTLAKSWYDFVINPNCNSSHVDGQRKSREQMLRDLAYQIWTDMQSEPRHDRRELQIMVVTLLGISAAANPLATSAGELAVEDHTTSFDFDSYLPSSQKQPHLSTPPTSRVQEQQLLQDLTQQADYQSSHEQPLISYLDPRILQSGELASTSTDTRIQPVPNSRDANALTLETPRIDYSHRTYNALLDQNGTYTR